MKKAIIFGGTTEGRKVADLLLEQKVSVVYCVATEYGKEPIVKRNGLDVRIGRMDSNEMRDLFGMENPDVVIDATHPFAEIVKKEIDNALFMTGKVPFVRIIRPTVESDFSNCTFFEDVSSCAKALEETSGNILLTT